MNSFDFLFAFLPTSSQRHLPTVTSDEGSDSSLVLLMYFLRLGQLLESPEGFLILKPGRLEDGEVIGPSKYNNDDVTKNEIPTDHYSHKVQC